MFVCACVSVGRHTYIGVFVYISLYVCVGVGGVGVHKMFPEVGYMIHIMTASPAAGSTVPDSVHEHSSR